jgi:ATP-binding cassette subfamily B protein
MHIIRKITGKLAKIEIRRALQFVWESGPRWTIANIVLIIIQGVLPLLPLYLTKLVLDEVASTLTLPEEAKMAAFGRIATLIGLLAMATLLNTIARLVGSLVTEIQAQIVTDHMYDILHAKSIEVDLEYYENSKYYDTLHRAQQEAPTRPTRIVNTLLGIGQSSVALLAMTGLLVTFHWGIALLLFVAALPGIITRVHYAERVYLWTRQRTPKTRRSNYYNWLLTGDIHAKEVRLFNLGGIFMGRSKDLRTELREERLAMTKRYYFMDLLTQVSALVAVFISYGFIAYRTVMGQLTWGDLGMYYQAFQRAQGYLGSVMGGIAGLYESSLFLSNLYEFLDLKRAVIEPTHPQPVPRPMQDGIVFDHVNFHYPTSDRPVLEDINMTVLPGEVVALVGENGSGKTTLIKLLCRLYDPTGGHITIDNQPLSRFTTTDLRREISVIFQDYARYQLTARENIWFGNVDLPTHSDAVVDAARESGADDLISGLKNGYDTVLGKWFEDGEELSIGEWQKVALARAFLRDSQVVVLDEPTSAMDARAEHEVFIRFRELIEGRSAIIISHRLSTVKMADCIYVLEDGRIVESGTHDELVALDGAYARMFEIQAQHYR